MATTIADLRKAEEDAEQAKRRGVATVELLRAKGDMDEHNEVCVENRLVYLDQKAVKAAAGLEAFLKEHDLVVKPQDWLKFMGKAKAMAEIRGRGRKERMVFLWGKRIKIEKQVFAQNRVSVAIPRPTILAYAHRRGWRG
jgi:hypothetical protein